MATETRIRLGRCTKLLEGHDGTRPLEEGPSYVRFICRVKLWCASLRLAGEGNLDRDDVNKFTLETECKLTVDDPAVFLDYEETRRMAWLLFTGMPGLCSLDLSRSNWRTPMPDDVVAASMHRLVKRNDGEGLSGGQYRFHVRMDVKVQSVFSEPMALVGSCILAETRAGDKCAICQDGLMTSAKRSTTPPANLPCGHAFHPRCITTWLFKGATCPLCRDDLRGLVSPPWENTKVSCPDCVGAPVPCGQHCPNRMMPDTEGMYKLTVIN